MVSVTITRAVEAVTFMEVDKFGNENIPPNLGDSTMRSSRHTGRVSETGGNAGNTNIHMGNDKGSLAQRF